MHDRTNVLVVDDELVLRKLWQRLLDGQPDLACVGTSERADGLCELVSSTGARVVLLDLNLPGIDAIAAIRELAANGDACRVVVCSGVSDPSTIKAAIDAGAWGFVDKISPPNYTLDVIRRVAAGEFVLPLGLA